MDREHESVTVQFYARTESLNERDVKIDAKRLCAINICVQYLTLSEAFMLLLFPVFTASRPGYFSGITLGYGLDGRGFESRQGLGNFLFTTSFIPVLGPTQPPIQWVSGALSLG
jgi:hypothetical protein